VEEGTADVVETARKLELEVEPEDGAERLPSHDKLEWMRNCFLQMSKDSGFLTWHLLRGRYREDC